MAYRKYSVYCCNLRENLDVVKKNISDYDFEGTEENRITAIENINNLIKHLENYKANNLAIKSSTHS